MPRPVYSQAERRADAVIHVAGVGAALIAVPTLITLAVLWSGEAATIAAAAVYGASMIAMLSSLGDQLHHGKPGGAHIAACLSKPVKQSVLFDCLANVVSDEAGNQPDGGGFCDHVISAPKQFRILLAEDNPVNQKVTLAQLRRLGYEADAVPDGKKAVEALRQMTYDLILMDCQMPNLDGYEATAVIRDREPGARHIPIVALTANALSGEREKCLAAGMDDYLSKPVKLEDLAGILEKWAAAAAAP